MAITPRIAALTASAVALAGLGVAVWAISQPAADDPFRACRSAGSAVGARIGGPFTLVDETGATVTDRDVITRPSLIYFGYSFCPDVCPVDSARNAEAVDLLDAMGIEVTPVFISIDPRRDTPQVLRDFTDLLHPRMIGLTGTPEQVAAASQAYRTYYKINDATDTEFYTVDHSTLTYLVLPGQGHVESFGRSDTVSPQQLAERVACFVRTAPPEGRG